jgi:hypothetical protein
VDSACMRQSEKRGCRHRGLLLGIRSHTHNILSGSERSDCHDMIFITLHEPSVRKRV